MGIRSAIDWNNFISRGHDGDSGWLMNHQRGSSDRCGQSEFDWSQARTGGADDITGLGITSPCMNRISMLDRCLKSDRRTSIAHFMWNHSVQIRGYGCSRCNADTGASRSLHVAHGPGGNEAIACDGDIRREIAMANGVAVHGRSVEWRYVAIGNQGFRQHMVPGLFEIDPDNRCLEPGW